MAGMVQEIIMVLKKVCWIFCLLNRGHGSNFRARGGSFAQYQSGRLNQGTGYQRAANNSYTIGQTTNEEPYRVIREGQRMPKPVVNPNK